MSDTATIVLGVLGTVLAAAITGFVSWRIARRRTSGSVNTSEAASLWQEGAALRTSLTEQVIGLRTQLTEATGQVGHLLRELQLSNEATAAAREETRLSREESRELRSLMTQVHDEVKTANALSLGNLADNTETRRIGQIPAADRTAEENEHYDTLGISTGAKDDK